MSRLSRVLLFLGFIFLICWFIAMRALGGNLMPIVWVILGLGVACILAAIFKDIKFFTELAGQRTTKHGLNLGALVLIVTGILVGVNFISYRHVKKFDFTKEKLHSISEQTTKILKNLDDDVQVRGFFNDNQMVSGGEGDRFKSLTDLYAAQTTHVKFTSFNPVKRPDIAKTYEVTSFGTVMIEYKTRKARVEDLTEQGFTNALIKITRDKNKIVYVVKGHGEHDIEVSEPNGLGTFKKYMTDSSYDIKTLSFTEQTKVPEDAALLVIAGPKHPYFDPEIAAVREYLYNGGKLFLALDPDTKSNVTKLAQMVGIEFKNNFIIDQLGQLMGQSAAMAIGASYSNTSEITKGFNAMTVFYLASQLKPLSGKPDGITIEDLVRSSPRSFSKAELKGEQVRQIPGQDEQGPLTIVASAIGKLKEEAGKPAPKEFQAVVAGDSDFLSNQLIDAAMNHDLALNSVAFLAKDKELVSIRPKTPEGTTITVTSIQKTLLLYGLVFIAPLLIFVSGGSIWYRRRTA